MTYVQGYGYATRTEVEGMGLDPADYTFVFPTAEWGGSINTPTPKARATDPRKNKTPRQGDPDLYNHAPVSNLEVEKEYGPEFWASFSHAANERDEDAMVAHMDAAMGSQIRAANDRLRHGKRWL
jgi:hypothetical protein